MDSVNRAERDMPGITHASGILGSAVQILHSELLQLSET